MISIVPDTQAIRTLYGRRRDGDDRQARRVAALADTLRLISNLAREMTEVLPGLTRDITNASRALDENVDDAEAQRLLRNALARHGSLVQQLLTFLAERGVNMEAALSTAEPNYEALATLAKQEAEQVGQSFAEAAENLREQGSLQSPQIRISAVRAGRRPATQLHVTGYDNLPAGDPTPVEKLAFELTSQEAADVQRGHDAATDFITFSREIRTLVQGAERDLATVASLVRMEIDSIQATLDSLPEFASLETLRTELLAAPETQELASELEKLIGLMRPLINARTLHRSILEEFRRNPSANIPFEQLGSRRKAMTDALNRLPPLPQLSVQLTEQFKTLERVSTRALQSELGSRRAAVLALGQQHLPRWNRHSAVLGSVAQKYRNAIDQLDRVSRLADLVRGARRFATSDLSEEEIAANLTTVNVEAAVPGQLLLGRNVDQRDEIRLTLQIIDAKGGRPLSAEERNLGVRTFGFHRRVTGGIAFTAEEGKGYAPGISTSFILHHQPRPENGASPLDPSFLGLGLTSVVLTRDGRIELGLGPTVTLLGDLVQAGVGWNLQTNQRYLMLGTPLLDLMDRLRGTPDQ